MKKTLNIILAAVLSIAVLYFAGSQGWLDNTPLESLKLNEVNNAPEQIVEQTKQLGSQVGEVGGHVRNVLGDNVEVDEEKADKALHEKTIDYAKYMYCKQVVEEFENKF